MTISGSLCPGETAVTFNPSEERGNRRVSAPGCGGRGLRAAPPHHQSFFQAAAASRASGKLILSNEINPAANSHENTERRVNPFSCFLFTCSSAANQAECERAALQRVRPSKSLHESAATSRKQQQANTNSGIQPCGGGAPPVFSRPATRGLQTPQELLKSTFLPPGVLVCFQL